MTNFTPRYSIPYPTEGDPVYIGASQMEALAKSVDNHMGEVSDASALDATTEPTPGRIIQRDDAGRAQVAAPDAAADIANKQTVDNATASVRAQFGGLTLQERSTAPPAGTADNVITFVVEA